MPSETPTKEQIAGWLWDNRDWIVGKLKDIYAWFRGSSKNADSRGILILGPGGVGKTTLARLLSGQFDLLLDGLKGYDESIGIERYTLTDAPDVEIVVPPGQKHRREATWPSLHAAIASGSYRGVILVSAYGYHSLGRRSLRDYRFKGKKNALLKELWNSNRDDEIGVLKQLQPHLAANPNKMWFVSLIAKQDLWWPEDTVVQKHYRDGAYGRVIRRILTPRASVLRHEFVFVSLLIARLVSESGEELKLNAAGYDYLRQIQSLRRLFETMAHSKIGSTKNERGRNQET